MGPADTILALYPEALAALEVAPIDKAMAPSVMQPALTPAKVAPTQPVGVSGIAVYGGYLQSIERSHDLVGLEKWRKFDEWKRTITVVGAALRAYLTLTGSPRWDCDPYKAPDADEPTPDDVERAQWARGQLYGMGTPWANVVQVASLATFDGYEMQAWTAKRMPDGRLGLADVEWRPGHTIEQWSLDPTGSVLGVVQRSPQDGSLVPIDRARLVYSRDLPLTNNPEGVGVLRQLAEAIREYEELRRLRNQGFEKDVNGIPITYAPILAKRALIGTVDENGKIYTQADYDAEMEAIRTFASSKKRKDAGLVLDSSTYKTIEGNPTSSPLFKADVLRAAATSHAELNASIHALAWDMLILLGFEHLLLGREGAGSLAMHASKIEGTLRIVTSALNRVAETMRRDLLRPLWLLNGWDPDTTPMLTWNTLEFENLERVVTALATLLTGAAVEPGRADDAVEKILVGLGLPRLKEPDAEDMMLKPKGGDQQQKPIAGAGAEPDKPEPDEPITKGMGSIVDEED